MLIINISPGSKTPPGLNNFHIELTANPQMTNTYPYSIIQF